MGEAIIWTNADPIHWHIYAALGVDKLTHAFLLMLRLSRRYEAHGKYVEEMETTSLIEQLPVDMQLSNNFSLLWMECICGCWIFPTKD